MPQAMMLNRLRVRNHQADDLKVMTFACYVGWRHHYRRLRGTGRRVERTNHHKEREKTHTGSVKSGTAPRFAGREP